MKRLYIIMCTLIITFLFSGCSSDMIDENVGNIMNALGKTTEQDNLTKMQGDYDKTEAWVKIGDSIKYTFTNIGSNLPLIGDKCKSTRDNTLLGGLKVQEGKANDEILSNQKATEAVQNGIKTPYIIIPIILVLLLLIMILIRSGRGGRRRSMPISQGYSSIPPQSNYGMRF